jgi:uncharacterized membrane protein
VENSSLSVAVWEKLKAHFLSVCFEPNNFPKQSNFSSKEWNTKKKNKNNKLNVYNSELVSHVTAAISSVWKISLLGNVLSSCLVSWEILLFSFIDSHLCIEHGVLSEHARIHRLKIRI